MIERDLERNGVLDTCEALGIGFVPLGPVGTGFLTGKMDARTKLNPKTDLRAGFDHFAPEALAANQPMTDLVARIAKQENATPSQIALAWLWRRGHGSCRFPARDASSTGIWAE